MKKNIFTTRNIIGAVIIVAILIGGWFLFFNKKTTTQTLTVHPTDFLQQVSASGNVVAKNDLDLSFQQAGQVAKVYVAVGDTLTAGQLLASQDTSELNAQLAGMEAGIDLQKAKLAQLLAGASPENIQSAKDAVTLAEQNLDNTYTNSLTTLLNASGTIYNAYTTVNALQNNYFTGTDQPSFTVEGSEAAINNDVSDSKKYLASAQSSLSDADIDTAIVKIIADLNDTYNDLVIIRQQCDLGVYYSKVTATDKASLDTQKININTAITSITSIQSTIASDTITLKQAQDNLAVTSAPPQSSDIAVDQAQIEQAQASEQGVIAQINQEKIYSPINGIVTVVNAKVGSLMSPSDVAVSVIGTNNFEVDSFVPEINIALINVGNSAVITLDAYGSNVPFFAKVISIDPAQTIVDGVSTYKVILDFTNNNDPRIKSGMTGNIIITTEKKSNIISVPQGIVSVKNGQSFVKVQNGKTITNQQITTGDIASNGNIEVTSGLKDGDVVVLN